MPLLELRVYLSAYKRFAVITAMTRHTSDNRVLPTLNRGGTWTDGTPLTDEENLVAKERFDEIEELRKPLSRTDASSDDQQADDWPFITW